MSEIAIAGIAYVAGIFSAFGLILMVAVFAAVVKGRKERKLNKTYYTGPQPVGDPNV